MTSKKLKSFSIFFPVFNDAHTLIPLVYAAISAAKKITKNFEILLIENGSTDNSLTVARRLAKKYREVKVIHFDKPLGYGGAIREGLSRSRKDFIFYTDADGQYDPKEIIKLAGLINDNVDVVNGYKTARADNWLRKILGDIYNRTLHLIYPIPIKDVDCDFRLIRRSALKNLTLKTSSAVTCLELILKLQDNGARFREVGIHHFPRQFGHSTFFHSAQIFQTLKEHFQFLVATGLKRL